MLIIGESRCKPGFFGEFCESECKCGNSLDENVCDRTTGKCDLCKFGFGGRFCTGKQGFFMKVESTTSGLGGYRVLTFESCDST